MITFLLYLSTAYIAPGICYLGVFGEDFLDIALDLLKKRHKVRKGRVSHADLPLDGNISCILSIDAYEEIASLSKPLWWYIGLFPLWCKIAKIGMDNMNDRVSGEAEITKSCDDTTVDDIMVSSGKEFSIAIFFIVFGFVAETVGLGSIFYLWSMGNNDTRKV